VRKPLQILPLSGNGEYAPMSSIVVPIKYNGQFVGVAGVDVILGTFQDKVVK